MCVSVCISVCVWLRKAHSFPLLSYLSRAGTACWVFFIHFHSSSQRALSTHTWCTSWISRLSLWAVGDLAHSWKKRLYVVWLCVAMVLLVWVCIIFSFVVREWNTYPVFPCAFWIFLNDGLKAFQKDLTGILEGVKK